MSDLAVVGRPDHGLSIREVRRSRDGLVDRALLVLTKSGLTAGTWVHALPGSGFDGLTEFFHSMGADWRGWDGERTWSSLEGDLMMAARHDGHVRMVVRISHSTEWTVEADLTLHPGEDLNATIATVTEVLGST